jgi:mono/diheme cytochrome c family protein
MIMRSQVYLQPGETLGCAGCHEPRTSAPPVGTRVARPSVRPLDPPAGPRYPGGFSFARTVQPVLDRYCVGCHGAEKPAAKLSLVGTPAGRFNGAYENLTRRGGLVSVAHRNREADVTRPKLYGAHAGRLGGFLLGEHRKRVRLDPASFERIAQWLDLNAQYYGDYGAGREAERRSPDADALAALREHLREACGACHPKLADAPAAALVNVALPDQSRALLAPLATKAGGWGLCKERWPGTDDPGYDAMRKAVFRAAGRAEAGPDGAEGP